MLVNTHRYLKKKDNIFIPCFVIHNQQYILTQKHIVLRKLIHQNARSILYIYPDPYKKVKQFTHMTFCYFHLPIIGSIGCNHLQEGTNPILWWSWRHIKLIRLLLRTLFTVCPRESIGTCACVTVVMGFATASISTRETCARIHSYNRERHKPVL